MCQNVAVAPSRLADDAILVGHRPSYGYDQGDESYIPNLRPMARCGRPVMDRYPPDAWRRLGRLLERRRGELGYGFRQRARFVRDGGVGAISVKTISRLEKGERDSYPESTIGTVEAIYQWSPGSVESVLRGGDPSPLPNTQATRSNLTTADPPPSAGERIAGWVYVRMKQRGHGDDDIHDFLNAEGLPREPTTISAVKRIADVTGATVAEVLALLGVEDISSARRTLHPVPNGENGPSAGQATTNSRRAGK